MLNKPFAPFVQAAKRLVMGWQHCDIAGKGLKFCQGIEIILERIGLGFVGIDANMRRYFRQYQIAG